MDFVAFDFETANSRSDSACQLAAIRVEAGQIVQERKWNIRPKRLYFSPRNISIHGIRPEHVVESPTMSQVWPEFHELADGLPLIAHNAMFDMDVLVSSLSAWDIACPYLEFSCTRAIARRAWPGRQRYGLKPLGNWLGVAFQHHDALEDSRCCAKIALAAAAVANARSLVELEQRLRLTRGRYSLGRATGPRQMGGRSIVPATPSMFVREIDQEGPATAAPDNLSSDRPSASALPTPAAGRAEGAALVPSVAWTRSKPPARGELDAGAVVESSAGALPLAGKRIVCLGTLRGLTQNETRQLIETLGGQWLPTICAQAHYVVACGGILIGEATERVAEGTGQQSSTIRVLSERQFLALLPGGKAAVRW